MKLQRAQQSEPSQDLRCDLEPRRTGRHTPKRNGLLRSWVANGIEHGSAQALFSEQLYSSTPSCVAWEAWAKYPSGVSRCAGTSCPRLCQRTFAVTLKPSSFG